jgi:hypothetical protein
MVGTFTELDRPLRAQLRLDIAYRREGCERAGLGFDLGELGYKSELPIRPSRAA